MGSPLPVIFLTSKDDEVDELLGLRMGADDYIKKPFSQRLLIERIRALIRRGELARERDEAQAEPVVVRGQMTLDPARHLCTWRGEPFISAWAALRAPRGATGAATSSPGSTRWATTTCPSTSTR